MHLQHETITGEVTIRHQHETFAGVYQLIGIAERTVAVMSTSVAAVSGMVVWNRAPSVEVKQAITSRAWCFHDPLIVAGGAFMEAGGAHTVRVHVAHRDLYAAHCRADQCSVVCHDVHDQLRGDDHGGGDGRRYDTGAGAGAAGEDGKQRLWQE